MDQFLLTDEHVDDEVEDREAILSVRLYHNCKQNTHSKAVQMHVMWLLLLLSTVWIVGRGEEDKKVDERVLDAREDLVLDHDNVRIGAVAQVRQVGHLFRMMIFCEQTNKETKRKANSFVCAYRTWPIGLLTVNEKLKVCPAACLIL